MSSISRKKLFVATSFFLAALFAACAGPAGPAGPQGPTGAAGPTGPAAAIPTAAAKDIPAGVVISPPSVIQGQAMSLSGWGFNACEAWVAYMSLGKGKPEAVLSGGETTSEGVFGATGITVAAEARNLIPVNTAPGFYYVTVEGSEGSRAFSTLQVLLAPTAIPKPAATATPAGTATPKPPPAATATAAPPAAPTVAPTKVPPCVP